MLEWSEDPIKLISTALQPAAISAVIIVNGQEQVDDQGRRIKKRAAVFVEEAQRPMAIGKKGQNIRLATELTGYELDMYNYEELPAFKAKLAELRGGDAWDAKIRKQIAECALFVPVISAATQAGIKKVDEIEFFDGGASVLSTLRAVRDDLRDELASALGVRNLHRTQAGGYVELM